MIAVIDLDSVQSAGAQFRQNLRNIEADAHRVRQRSDSPRIPNPCHGFGELRLLAVHIPDGGFVQTITDITQRRAAEARITRLASEDPLTGLPNRRVFRSVLDRVCPQDPAADAVPAVESGRIAAD